MDLRNFFRYIKQVRDPSLKDKRLDEISILDVDLDFVKSVTLTDVYGYMTYLSRDRVQHQNSSASDYGLNAASRARKIATLRSFYNYLTNKVHLISENPVKDIDSPKTMKTLPKYLTLDESIQLLDSVDGKNRERDYCILTLFLNCGLRISELVGLDLNDIQDEALRILGKGNKSASSTRTMPQGCLRQYKADCGSPSWAGIRTLSSCQRKTNASADPVFTRS